MRDLEPAATTMEQVCDGIDDDQLDAPTPCDVPVAQVLAHVLGLCVAFREAGRKLTGPATETPPGLAEGTLAEDWREQLPVLLDDLVQAWRDPGAWEGSTQIAGMTMPAEQVGVTVADELVVHAWDLAVSTGQPYDPAPASLEAAWEMVSAIPDDPAVRGGLFGPVVRVDDDAPLLDRLLGGAGRDPRWAPASLVVRTTRSGRPARG